MYALTSFDNAPEYRSAGLGNEIVRIEKNDGAYFESRHNGHHQQELIVLDPALYSEGAYIDPGRITYLTATNGKEILLIKKWRKTVTEALRYDLVQGRLEIKTAASIQEEALRRQLFYEIKKPALAEDTVRAFIEIFREQALQCDFEQKSGEVCASTYAHIYFQPLTDEQITKILSQCKALFTKEEWKRLAGFVMNSCHANGVMSVVIRKTARLIPTPYPLRVKKWFQHIFSQHNQLGEA
jgi:hypothetical protein